MSRKNMNRGRNLVTDKKTDYLYDYFVNEDKFNEQLRGEWDKEMDDEFKKHKNPKLSGAISENNSRKSEHGSKKTILSSEKDRITI
jgi:hypothetical protein